MTADRIETPLPPLACRDVVELVSAYLERALVPELEAALEAHLDECPGCRTFLDQVRHTVAALRALDAPAGLTPEARDALVRRLRSRMGDA